MQSPHSLAPVGPGTLQEVRNNWLPRSRLSLVTALGICVAVSVGAIALTLSRHSGLSSASRAAANAELLDQRLQRAATQALGDRRGTIIVMDPQTGRIRAIEIGRASCRERV